MANFPDILSINQRKDMKLIAMILSYMETPQYLRKLIFKIKPELRYVGILPPLRTPHHPLSSKIKELTLGEYREGVVTSSSKVGSLVEIGVEQPIIVPKIQLNVGARVTVRIVKLGKRPEAEVVDLNKVKYYWGYRVTMLKEPLGRFIRRKGFDLVIATSRYGKPITEVMEGLKKYLEKSSEILISFGSPTKGLHEIVAQENLKLEDITQFIINTIPNQGTKTVRTEEAIYASLAILNILMEEQTTSPK